MLAISLIICGAACILYGVSIMLVWSGTAFFALWYLMGAAAVAAGIAMHLGLWQHLPAALARGIGIASLVALTGVVSLSIFLMGVAATCDPDEAPDDLDYLVVLGAQVYGNKEPSVVLRFRLDAALAYLKGHEGCKVVVSGGRGPNEPITEAECMATYLERQGIPPERIVREGASASTRQNLALSKEKMEQDSGTDVSQLRVGVVTNNFHVFRATRIAQRLGMPGATGISGSMDPWYVPNNLLRECLGVAKDALLGRL